MLHVRICAGGAGQPAFLPRHALPNRPSEDIACRSAPGESSTATLALRRLDRKNETAATTQTHRAPQR
jgi:hypothetical protein